MCYEVERLHPAEGATEGKIIALPFFGNLWTRKRGLYFNEIGQHLKYLWVFKILGDKLLFTCHLAHVSI